MSSSVPTTSQVPKTARIPEIPDLERLQKIKSSGGRLSEIDEQRLRNHQLRMLRRKWIFDQRLSAREPLHPPLTWREKLKCREEAFWNKKLDYRMFGDMLQGKAGAYKQIPWLLFYKAQRTIRNATLLIYLPGIPFLCMMYMHLQENPGNMISSSMTPVFPGEEYKSAKRPDIYVDPWTHQRYTRDELTEEQFNRFN